MNNIALNSDMKTDVIYNCEMKDFFEVNKHGTDVEVLMAKSHFFRDPIVSKFEQWQTLSQDAPPGFERLMGNGTEMLRSLLSSFGSVQVQALRPLDARPRALIAEGTLD